jgi:hypothetical protein
VVYDRRVKALVPINPAIARLNGAPGMKGKKRREETDFK